MAPKSSRFRGVTLFKPTGKWRAQISAGAWRMTRAELFLRACSAQLAAFSAPVAPRAFRALRFFPLLTRRARRRQDHQPWVRTHHQRRSALPRPGTAMRALGLRFLLLRSRRYLRRPRSCRPPRRSPYAAAAWVADMTRDRGRGAHARASSPLCLLCCALRHNRRSLLISPHPCPFPRAATTRARRAPPVPSTAPPSTRPGGPRCSTSPWRST